MPRTADLVFDAATSLGLGKRSRQEDAVAADFARGEPFGFVVLADGMGGHAAGDVASRIVVSAVFSELKLQPYDPDRLESRIGKVLRAAASNANRRVGRYSRTRPDTRGMGATLLAPVLIRDSLYWLSVGDSPLYLYRDDALVRLNDNHTVMAQSDYLVANGIMDRQTALNHPDKGCLTSVLIGRDIAQIDCRTKPVRIGHDDILIAASDGLQTMSDAQIEAVLSRGKARSADEIGTMLMAELDRQDDPFQDNVSMCVIKVIDPAQTARPAPKVRTAHASQRFGNSNVSLTIMAKVDRPREATLS